MTSSNGTKYKTYENYSAEIQRELEEVKRKRNEAYRQEKRKKQRESNMVAQIAVAIALAVVLLLSTLVTRASLVEAHNELYATQKTYQVAQNEYDRISLELSKAKALDKIDTMAREKLGMVAPSSFSTIIVSSVKHSDVGTVNATDAASTGKVGVLPTILAFFYPIVERVASSVIAGWVATTADPLPTVLE